MTLEGGDVDQISVNLNRFLMVQNCYSDPHILNSTGFTAHEYAQLTSVVTMTACGFNVIKSLKMCVTRTEHPLI